MKTRTIPGIVSGALFACLLMAGAGTAAAEDARLNLLWVDGASGNTFEVISPTAAPLAAVKRRVMAEIGLVPGSAGNYQVEQTVATGEPLPSRDPQSGQTVWTPVNEQKVLDDGMTLGELGLEDGDTLTLSRIEGAGADAATRGRGR